MRKFQVNELIRIVYDFPVFSAIKRMLGWAGIACGECLPPTRNLSRDEEEVLRQRLTHSSLASQSWRLLII